MDRIIIVYIHSAMPSEHDSAAISDNASKDTQGNDLPTPNLPPSPKPQPSPFRTHIDINDNTCGNYNAGRHGHSECTFTQFYYDTVRDLDTEDYPTEEAEEEVIWSTYEDPCVFAVHENVLRSNSAFFDCALREAWKEGRDAEVHIGEQDPAAFDIYMCFAYEGHIAMEDDDLSQWESCYKLGLYLCDPDFNDVLIDWLVIEMRETGPFYAAVLLDLMSDLPRKTSEHRQLAIDTYLMELHNRWQPMIGTDWLPNFEKCDPDMFRKIMAAEQDVILKRYAGRDYSHEAWWGWDDICRYHEHGNGRCHRGRRGRLY